MSFVTRLHQDDRERVLAATHRTHTTGEPFRQSYRLIAKDGRVVHLLDETIPVSDERGRPLPLQGFLVEVGAAAAGAGIRDWVAFSVCSCAISPRSTSSPAAATIRSQSQRPARSSRARVN